MTYYFCCMGHGFILMEEAFWQPRCNLVASPHISVLVTSSQYLAAPLQSGGLATIFVSGDFVTISGSLAAISVVCSGWVGRVVSPHDVRLVRGCIRLDWVGIAFTFWFWFCHVILILILILLLIRILILILLLILILSPNSDSNSDSVTNIDSDSDSVTDSDSDSHFGSNSDNVSYSVMG